MKNFLIVLLMLFSILPASGQDVDAALSEKLANYPMSDKYKAGSFLIYDCWRGFYTCVDQDGFNKCIEERHAAMDQKKDFYPCAQLSKFPDRMACLKTNYEVVEAVAKIRFCYPKN